MSTTTNKMSTIHVRVTSGRFATRYVVKISHDAPNAGLVVSSRREGRFMIEPRRVRKIVMGVFDRIADVGEFLEDLVFRFTDGRDHRIECSTSRLVALNKAGPKLRKFSESISINMRAENN